MDSESRPGRHHEGKPSHVGLQDSLDLLHAGSSALLLLGSHRLLPHAKEGENNRLQQAEERKGDLLRTSIPADTWQFDDQCQQPLEAAS